ncbi:MAG: SBBP repeat-containing protein, partial [Bacteroidota bacterium]
MHNLIKYVITLILAFAVSSGFSQSVNWDWVKTGGGGGDDVGYSITTDNNGNIIVAGLFNSTALFDELYITSMTYHSSGFIAKYDNTGNILWLNKISGTRTTYIHSITTDLNNHIYVCGHFTETTYAEADSLTSNGSSDAFIGKYDAQGNLMWIKSIGGIELDGSAGLICSDSLLFVAGEFRESACFDSTLLISAGNSDVFLACLDFNGNYQWIKQAGGAHYDVPRSITIDNNSDVIIAGHINTNADFGNADTSVNTYGSADPFVAKYSPDGTFQWVNSFGGIGGDRGISVISDIDNNLFLHGHFYGTAYFDTITLQSSGDEDYFISKLNSNGTVAWANKICTTVYPMDDNWNHTLENDEQGNIFITGWFMDSLSYDGYSVQSNGSYDIFVIKIDPNGDLIWCLTAGNDHS